MHTCSVLLEWRTPGIAISKPGLRSQSRKESEVFGWSQSRIPNNTGSQIFLSDLPLILTAKFQSLDVKASGVESEILERSESGVGNF